MWQGSLGRGQTWIDASASRALGTYYTNASGKPIEINVTTGTTSATTLYFMINGVSIYGSAYYAGGGQVSGSAVIPSGGSYAAFLTSGGTNGFALWRELR